MKDFLKKMWPTVLAFGLAVLAGFDPSIREALTQFAVAHPTLASLASVLYVALANWLRGLQVPPVHEAEAALDKAIEKRDAKG